MVSEVKAVETLVCGTSQSWFKSRQTPSRKMPLNGRQPVLKTGVQATVEGTFGNASCWGSRFANAYNSSIFLYPPEAEK